MRCRTRKAAALVLLCAVGCSSAPSGDAERVASRGEALRSDGDEWYPLGPYGTGVGDTIANLTFSGKSDDDADGSLVADSLKPIALSSYARHDQTKTKVLLVSACAQWCSPCQQEAPKLVALWQAYRASNPGEVAFVAALLENQSFGLPTERTLDQWAARFRVPYDMWLDPTLSLLAYKDPAVEAAFPTHILVRTKRMTIDHEWIGSNFVDDGSIKSAIDAILAEPESP